MGFFRRVFRQGQPPPPTLAMAAGGGGRIYALRLLLDQAITIRKRYKLLVYVNSVIWFVLRLSGETATTGHRDHGGRWW